MANPAKDMILFPAGGMSVEDTGGADVQKPALEASPHDGNSSADGDLPSIPGVMNFAQGPAVIQNKGGGEKTDCAPGKVGAESSRGGY